MLNKKVLKPTLTAAGVPFTGDAETDAVLNDHPDILERISRLEGQTSRLTSIDELMVQYLGITCRDQD